MYNNVSYSRNIIFMKQHSNEVVSIKKMQNIYLAQTATTARRNNNTINISQALFLLGRIFRVGKFVRKYFIRENFL
jgi:hypothetical protein